MPKGKLISALSNIIKHHLYSVCGVTEVQQVSVFMSVNRIPYFRSKFHAAWLMCALLFRSFRQFSAPTHHNIQLLFTWKGRFQSLCKYTMSINGKDNVSMSEGQ